MSTIEQEVQDFEQEARPGSLQDRIARRQREIEAQPEHTIVIPVPDFEDILAVQYQTLDYRKMMAIEARQEKNKDTAEGVLFVAADKLINACVRIVEPTDDPNGDYKDTGYKWGLDAARNLFGKDLPDNTSARQAVIACFRDEETLVRHAGDWATQREEIRKRVDTEALGESAASTVAT